MIHAESVTASLLQERRASTKTQTKKKIVHFAMNTLNRSATSISLSALPDLLASSSQLIRRGASLGDPEALRVRRRWDY